jgi:GNAT superfamily N-acetyltransferase
VSQPAEAIGAPAPLTPAHDLATFASGVATLDDWLRRRALANQATGATRTYVACVENRVVGYYALASGAVGVGEAPGRIRRNMPDPIPMVVLARQAIDQGRQRHGLGAALLSDAIDRCRQAAHIIGVRGVLVHAISEDAARFYRRYGFVASTLEPMSLLFPLN